MRLILEIEKQDIAYITGVFEGYDDLAVVRTLDAERGRIELIVAPDFLRETEQVVSALQEEIPLRRVDQY